MPANQYAQASTPTDSEALLYKIGHRFTPDNLAPCKFKSRKGSLFTVEMNGGGLLVDKAKSFYKPAS